MKATAVTPSNIAFIKYWGKRDEDLKIPMNGSISMNLSNLLTTTTVEFNKAFKEDIIHLRHSGEEPQRRLQNLFRLHQGSERFWTHELRSFARMTEFHETQRVIKHLDRIRSVAKINTYAKVVSVNNFPSGTGLSSSASGFAALTLAASKASGLNLSEKELSILARQGSGSACRSIPDGFVEWIDGESNEASYAVSLFAPNYWDIVDIVAIVSRNKKEVSTTEGQKLAKSSPFLSVRLEKIKEKIALTKKYLKEKNFKLFGELIEQEALELHAIMLTSTPPLIYLLPETIRVIREVLKWRQEGLRVYFTLNTGQNIHLICQAKDKNEIVKKVSKLLEIKQIIINNPTVGARIVHSHLF